MRVKIDCTQTLEHNADLYFQKAKKARKKLLGVERAMQEQEKQAKKKVVTEKRKVFWFEKYRWFITSDGFLCVGGRDATTNELVIKKHTEPNDLVLHTDMAGSPFVVIKSEGKEITDQAITEAAQFTACMSRAWKQGLGTLDVFYVKPEQVTKEAQAGESLPRGAFMIRGETKYKHPELRLHAGVIEHEGNQLFMVGPEGTIAGDKQVLVPGTDKTSDVAKQLKKLAPSEDLDAIIKQLPAGGIQIT